MGGEIIKKFDGLICIDLWEAEMEDSDPYTPEYHLWLEDISRMLKEMQFDHVVNASLHTKIDSDPSIKNTIKHYVQEQPHRGIEISLANNCNTHTMSSKIVDRVFGDNAFHFSETDLFVYHLEHLATEAKSWLVVGQTWQCCTHRQDMGLLGFSTHPRLRDISFYGSPWGFFTGKRSCHERDFFSDPTVHWRKVENALFELVHTDA